MRLVNEEGRLATPGQVGELQGLGPSCFSGYYRNPEATLKTWTSDGWFPLGDLGQWDDNGNLALLTVRPLRKVWENISSRGTFRLHWWLAEYVGGELVLEKKEVSAARWLTVDEISGLKIFEGDREFYQEVMPSLAKKE